MVFVAIFVGLMVLLVGVALVASRNAGPSSVSETQLAAARPMLRVTANEPGEGWAGLGVKTVARGLDLRFDHDDDPEAEATLELARNGAGEDDRRPTYGNVRSVRLAADWQTAHVHTAGYAFRLELRGTGRVIDREVRIQMIVDSGGKAVSGRIENDDDTDAAVGDWIEIASAEILKLRQARR